MSRGCWKSTKYHCYHLFLLLFLLLSSCCYSCCCGFSVFLTSLTLGDQLCSSWRVESGAPYRFLADGFLVNSSHCAHSLSISAFQPIFQCWCNFSFMAFFQGQFNLTFVALFPRQFDFSFVEFRANSISLSWRSFSSVPTRFHFHSLFQGQCNFIFMAICF